MTTIVFAHGDTVEKENVIIKNSGWVKAFDRVEGSRGNKEYEGLEHYPPQEIGTIVGKAIHESAHGQI
jgi:hypothetical protein